MGEEVALAKAVRLADEGKVSLAFSYILQAERIIPDDPVLKRVRGEISHSITIRTNPSGASIWIKAYDEPNAEWQPIGTTPLKNFLLPLGYFRWKAAKPGFQTVEAAAGFQSDSIDFTLDPESRLPPTGVGTKRVGSSSGLGPLGTYDMAGNVREWCWNASGKHRYVAGGGWNDKRYIYADLNAADPFNRSEAKRLSMYEKRKYSPSRQVVGTRRQSSSRLSYGETGQQ